MSSDANTGSPAGPSPASLVQRYFTEIVDGRSDAAIDELFSPDCRIIRADRTTPIVGRDALRRFVRLSIRAVPEIRTTILSLIGNDTGEVAALIEHEVRFGPVVATPLGPCLARGRKATWQAMAFFRVVGGRIVEERVIRDEMAIMRQLGLLPAARWRASMSTVGRLARWMLPGAWSPQSRGGSQ